jgi:hypothetical protein
MSQSNIKPINSRCQALLCLSPASESGAKMLAKNHVAEPNLLVLTFLHPKFVVQCTGGVALRAFKLSSSTTTPWLYNS